MPRLLSSGSWRAQGTNTGDINGKTIACIGEHFECRVRPKREVGALRTRKPAIDLVFSNVC